MPASDSPGQSVNCTMNENSNSPPLDSAPELESWEESRSGAWAGRGFLHQHMVSALILVRQWAGLAPPGYLVPEGFDDCVIELSDRRIWLQIKSRKDATFREAEVRGILDAVDGRAARLPNGSDIRSTVILEQPRTNKVEAHIAQIFDDEAGRVFICRRPDEEVVRLLLTKLEVAEVIAQGLASDLYKLVADASAQNSSLSFDERRRISTTEVDRRIFERLEAEDPSAIDHALLSGALEPVDFATPLNEPDFYRGVKVKPGHVAANLVLDRPNDVKRVLDTFWRRRHVLVSARRERGNRHWYGWRPLLLPVSCDGIRSREWQPQPMPRPLSGLSVPADLARFLRLVWYSTKSFRRTATFGMCSSGS